MNMGWIELLNQLSIFIGVWVAVYGIDSWRREHTGKRQIELAEDALALFYEASDAIKWIRHPFSLSSETEDVVKGERESDEEYDARKRASIVFSRYNKKQELFNKLHAMRYRFMAQIGKEKARPFDDLRNIVNEITMAAQSLVMLWPEDYFANEEQEEKHAERIKKYEAVFWDSEDEEDPINLKLEAIILKMETTCQSTISGKGTLFSNLKNKICKSS